MRLRITDILIDLMTEVLTKLKDLKDTEDESTINQVVNEGRG